MLIIHTKWTLNKGSPTKDKYSSNDQISSEDTCTEVSLNVTTGKVEYKFLSLHDTDNSGICAEDSTLKHIINGIKDTSPIPLNKMHIEKIN